MSGDLVLWIQTLSVNNAIVFLQVLGAYEMSTDIYGSSNLEYVNDLVSGNIEENINTL